MQTRGRISLVCGERALPCPGARVSRFTANLILQRLRFSGKSQTPNLFLSIVGVPFRETSGPLQSSSSNDERHSKGVALASHLRGHWPPPFLTSAVAPPFLLGSPAGLHFALWRRLVSGGSVLRLTFCPISLFHHWHPLLSNQRAVLSFLLFHELRGSIQEDSTGILESRYALPTKIHNPSPPVLPVYPWHFGQ